MRQATGEPLKDFVFLCSPAYKETQKTDANGYFEIDGIYLGRKTELGFVNPPDNDSCSDSAEFKVFTPTLPDQLIDLGEIKLPESGRLTPGTLDNLPGKQITELEGETLTGETLDWKKYAGKVVLLEFWATWCGPCLTEIPNLKKTYEKYHPQGFEIIGINIDDDLQNLEKGLDKYRFPWQVVADHKRKQAGKVRLYDRFAVRGVPRGILIDRSGKVITIETRGEKLPQELERLLR